MSRPFTPKPINASELQRKEIPEPVSVVPGFLLEGLNMLAGPSKIGKSWMMMGLAVELAIGGRAFGRIPVKPSEVVYLALEDSQARLKSRLRRLLPEASKWPSSLTFFTEWPRLGDAGGGKALGDWLTAHRAVRVVVVDIWQRLRPPKDKSKALYSDDYDGLAMLQQLAMRFHVAFVVVHHTNQTKAEDPMMRISGTEGVNGALDSAWVLKRTRGGSAGRMYVSGRDIEDRYVDVDFDQETCTWLLAPRKLSSERQAVVDLLTQFPRRNQELAADLGKPLSNMTHLTWKMLQDGDIEKDDAGLLYPSQTIKGGNRGNRGNEVREVITQD